jgi:hypothetical protein
VEGQALAEGVKRGRGRQAGRLPLQAAAGGVEVQLGPAGAGEWPVVFFAEGEAFAGAADVQLDAWFCQPAGVGAFEEAVEEPPLQAKVI